MYDFYMYGSVPIYLYLLTKSLYFHPGQRSHMHIPHLIWHTKLVYILYYCVYCLYYCSCFNNKQIQFCIHIRSHINRLVLRSSKLGSYHHHITLIKRIYCCYLTFCQFISLFFRNMSTSNSFLLPVYAIAVISGIGGVFVSSNISLQFNIR